MSLEIEKKYLKLFSCMIINNHSYDHIEICMCVVMIVCIIGKYVCTRKAWICQDFDNVQCQAYKFSAKLHHMTVEFITNCRKIQIEIADDIAWYFWKLTSCESVMMPSLLKVSKRVCLLFFWDILSKLKY